MWGAGERVMRGRRRDASFEGEGVVYLALI
jgi:hypothetical protein